jgi:hypothetical protein
MNTGLTIAFICVSKNHPTIENYNKFGDKYWDDSISNSSKIGYYFAYYFQKKYVRIHKIINILKPSERPIDMNWNSDRNILYLSNQLHEFTWNEWKDSVGFGSPYTPKYFNTKTTSWSEEALKRFSNFNFTNFRNIIDQPLMRIHSIPIDNIVHESTTISVIDKKEPLKYSMNIMKEIKQLKETKINTLIMEGNSLQDEIDNILIAVEILQESINIKKQTLECIEQEIELYK